MRALYLFLVCTLGAACSSSSEAQEPARASTRPASAKPASAKPASANSAYRVEVLELTPQPALTMRAQVAPAELEAKMKELMTKLIGYSMLEQIELAGPPFARYHARTAERIDFEAGIPTVKTLQGNAKLGIQASELPAGPAIATVHKGVYERLPEAHAALARWAKAQGKKARSGPWEVFLTNPMEERDPSRWRTKVFLPLVK